MMLDALRSLERSPADGAPGVPVMPLDSEEDAAALVAWFAGARSRARIRLVIDGEPAGCLERAVLLAALPNRVLGMGDSGGFELPGEVTEREWSFFELECPQAGCPESPVIAAAFTAEDPPRCRVHPELRLRLRA